MEDEKLKDDLAIALAGKRNVAFVDDVDVIGDIYMPFTLFAPPAFVYDLSCPKRKERWCERPVEIRTEPKIGRNAPCPCGSGQKYKKCCLNKESEINKSPGI